jgi:hypothetical protein
MTQINKQKLQSQLDELRYMRPQVRIETHWSKGARKIEGEQLLKRIDKAIRETEADLKQ